MQPMMALRLTRQGAIDGDDALYKVEVVRHKENIPPALLIECMALQLSMLKSGQFSVKFTSVNQLC